MADRRCKDFNWQVRNENGVAYAGSYEHAHLAVLMDLRDELKTLNRVFACQNFLDVPALLRAIKKNTTKKRRRQRA